MYPIAGESALDRKAAANILVAVVLAVGLILVLAGAYLTVQQEYPEATPAPTSTPTAVPTLMPSPTPEPTASPTATPTPVPSPTPLVRRASNWAGYIVATGTNLHSAQPNVTSVSASWTVPTVTPSTNNTYSAAWIGVGGEFDTTLIQCGTRQDSIGGEPSYSAWYELLPGNSIRVRSITVSPGDQMQASIQLADAAHDRWLINMSDLTSGDSFQNIFTYASSQLSAEWVLERPTVNNVLASLSNFDEVVFTNCTATIGNVTGSINSFPTLQIVMYSEISNPDTAQQLVDISPVSQDGTKFSVVYQSSP
jgi:hypothetical protein